MAKGDDSGIDRYDSRLELFNALLHMKQGTTSIDI